MHYGFRTRDNREWTISTVKKGNNLFFFKAKSRIIRNNKNFFLFSMVCLTLNIFILSTVFVHSILYHVILKCSFLSRLTKLCVVRNVLLCIKMLRLIFWFISVWSSSLVFLFNNLFIYFHKNYFFLPLLWVHPVKYTLSIVNSYFFVVVLFFFYLFYFFFHFFIQSNIVYTLR